jgi:hypothetical protein
VNSLLTIHIDNELRVTSIYVQARPVVQHDTVYPQIDSERVLSDFSSAVANAANPRTEIAYIEKGAFESQSMLEPHVIVSFDTMTSFGKGKRRIWNQPVVRPAVEEVDLSGMSGPPHVGGLRR